MMQWDGNMESFSFQLNAEISIYMWMHINQICRKHCLKFIYAIKIDSIEEELNLNIPNMSRIIQTNLPY